MRGMMSTILPFLAPAFNRLLRIEPGAFGRDKKREGLSPANLRAADDLAANREAHRERLGTLIPTEETRQQRRARLRYLAKQMRETEVQRAAMAMATFNGMKRGR